MAWTTVTIMKMPQASASVEEGTDQKIKALYVRGTATASADTLDLSAYFRSRIVSITGDTQDGLGGAQGTTWSGTTITLAGHASGTETWELIIWGY